MAIGDKVFISNATRDFVSRIAFSLRKEDQEEIEAASGMKAPGAVFTGWVSSEMAFGAWVNGEPAVLFGVGQGGSIWLVATDRITSAVLPVFRLSKLIVRDLLQRYQRLWNLADCRNTLHLRWLKLIGFTFDEIVSVNGHPFQRFHMNRETHQCATQLPS